MTPAQELLDLLEAEPYKKLLEASRKNLDAISQTLTTLGFNLCRRDLEWATGVPRSGLQTLSLPRSEEWACTKGKGLQEGEGGKEELTGGESWKETGGKPEDAKLGTLPGVLPSSLVCPHHEGTAMKALSSHEETDVARKAGQVSRPGADSLRTGRPAGYINPLTADRSTTANRSIPGDPKGKSQTNHQDRGLALGYKGDGNAGGCPASTPVGDLGSNALLPTERGLVSPHLPGVVGPRPLVSAGSQQLLNQVAASTAGRAYCPGGSARVLAGGPIWDGRVGPGTRQGPLAPGVQPAVEVAAVPPEVSAAVAPGSDMPPSAHLRPKYLFVVPQSPHQTSAVDKEFPCGQGRLEAVPFQAEVVKGGGVQDKVGAPSPTSAQLLDNMCKEAKKKDAEKSQAKTQVTGRNGVEPSSGITEAKELMKLGCAKSKQGNNASCIGGSETTQVFQAEPQNLGTRKDQISPGMSTAAGVEQNRVQSQDNFPAQHEPPGSAGAINHPRNDECESESCLKDPPTATGLKLTNDSAPCPRVTTCRGPAPVDKVAPGPHCPQRVTEMGPGLLEPSQQQVGVEACRPSGHWQLNQEPAGGWTALCPTGRHLPGAAQPDLEARVHTQQKRESVVPAATTVLSHKVAGADGNGESQDGRAPLPSGAEHDAATGAAQLEQVWNTGPSSLPVPGDREAGNDEVELVRPQRHSGGTTDMTKERPGGADTEGAVWDDKAAVVEVREVEVPVEVCTAKDAQCQGAASERPVSQKVADDMKVQGRISSSCSTGGEMGSGLQLQEGPLSGGGDVRVPYEENGSSVHLADTRVTDVGRNSVTPVSLQDDEATSLEDTQAHMASTLGTQEPTVGGQMASTGDKEALPSSPNQKNCLPGAIRCASLPGGLPPSQGPPETIVLPGVPPSSSVRNPDGAALEVASCPLVPPAARTSAVEIQKGSAEHQADHQADHQAEERGFSFFKVIPRRFKPTLRPRPAAPQPREVSSESPNHPGPVLHVDTLAPVGAEELPSTSVQKPSSVAAGPLGADGTRGQLGAPITPLAAEEARQQLDAPVGPLGGESSVRRCPSDMHKWCQAEVLSAGIRPPPVASCPSRGPAGPTAHDGALQPVNSGKEQFSRMPGQHRGTPRSLPEVKSDAHPGAKSSTCSRGPGDVNGQHQGQAGGGSGGESRVAHHVIGGALDPINSTPVAEMPYQMGLNEDLEPGGGVALRGQDSRGSRHSGALASDELTRLGGEVLEEPGDEEDLEGLEGGGDVPADVIILGNGPIQEQEDVMGEEVAKAITRQGSMSGPPFDLKPALSADLPAVEVTCLSRGPCEEVEAAEWAARQAEISRQQEEVRQLKERLKRRRQLEEQVEARVRRRMEEHKNQEDRVQATQHVRETVRLRVKAGLEQKLALALKQRDLRRLLMQLQVKVNNAPGRAPTPQELHSALKRAKIAYHPDKMQGKGMEDQVRAEEISKILNSWDKRWI